MRAWALAVAWLAQACASTPAPRSNPTPPASAAQQDPALVAAFVAIEEDAIHWLAAADPRLATRAKAAAPEAILARIGTDAVIAEDATAQVRGGSLDLFAFKGRERALRRAAEQVAAFRGPLPDVGPVDGPLARPKLEHELLGRLIEEELTRAQDEAQLADAAGDLVRAVVSTWTSPAVPQDWPDRDAWANKHLLEIRESLRVGVPRSGPLDLDIALYPLERLLAPLQFPRASAAIAQVRMALDEDMRAVPPLVARERVSRSVRVHLGVTLDSTGLRARLDGTEARLRELAVHALEASGDARRAVETRARELLFVERPCPAVTGTRVRAMAPPLERAAICGALGALTEEAAPAAALVALHDDVLLSLAAITTTPPPRTGLLSHPGNEDVDTLRRMARERPVVALGVALAADLLYGTEGADERLRAWRALGDAPLDVVARELNLTLR